MTVYIDLLWILNFFLDMVILLIVSFTLKRSVSFKRILLGSLIGSLSTILIFFKLSNLLLNLLKLILAIIIIIATFNLGSKKYFLNNLSYFYMTSIILGGFIYFLNNNFNSKYTLSINYLFIILLSPIILYLYLHQNKELKTNYQNYYDIAIILKDNTCINTKAYLDTGNTLKDPYVHKPIILLSKKLLTSDIRIHSPILVPYNSLNHQGFLTVIKPKYIKINNLKLDKYLIGLSEEEFGFDGINCILNREILKENI